MKPWRNSLRSEVDGPRLLIHRKDRRGALSYAFSLIELLVTVALILILTTLFWRATAGKRQHEQQAAAQALCQNNLEKLFVAMEIYANDHAGYFPIATNARTSE